MPSSKSAKKSLRQNEATRLRNRSFKSNMRTQIRKVREAIAAGEVESSESEFRLAVKHLDKAASRGVIHANSAARTKSRLSKAIKGLKTA